MGTKTAIRWTDTTWNPVIGCSKVSPGCAHCYAEELSKSPKMRPFGYTGLPWTPANAEVNVQLKPERLEQPLHWRDPRRVFVNSMSDLFHELVPDSFILQVFTIMRRCPNHIFQILTKRPDRMRDFMRRLSWYAPETDAVGLASRGWQAYLSPEHGYIPTNVWLGTSVENQHWADIRVPLLLDTPAAVHFLSCEPLLGPVSLREWIFDGGIPVPWQALSGDDKKLDWVIVGGESGPNRRAMSPEWARLLRDECTDAGVAFFFKQMGGACSETGQELDGRRWEQMPGQVA